jgi:hypothetical protein
LYNNKTKPVFVHIKAQACIFLRIYTITINVSFMRLHMAQSITFFDQFNYTTASGKFKKLGFPFYRQLQLVLAKKISLESFVCPP